MPAGVKSLIWNEAAQELRITYSNRPDSIFTPADIPSNIYDQGPQAVQDWMNANAEKFLWGPTAPPPFFLCRVIALTPLFVARYQVSDIPINPNVLDPPQIPP